MRTTVTLDPEGAARAVEWYNAQPPTSAWWFNLVVLIRYQDGTTALLGNDGMICIGDVVAPEDLPALMQAIVGDHT